jgi:UDP-N-acetylglucosamine:LPS N-acetylglucosamine transferase
MEMRHWVKAKAGGTPPSSRRAHSAAFCKKDNSLYIFGGGDGGKPLNDLHALRLAAASDEPVNVLELAQKQDGMRWERVSSSGNIPPARGYHTMNIVDHNLLVFGGSDGQECFSDLHVLDLGNQSDSSLPSLNMM